MEALDFSRSAYQPLETKENRLWDGILDFTRSDEVAVDFTGKDMIFNIYNRKGGTLLQSITSDDDLTIATARLTFDIILSELSQLKYYYLLWNDTDKIGAAHGPFTVK